MFFISRYVDEITCNVVPMQAIHLLFGRSLEFNQKFSHDGYHNLYSFYIKE